MVKFTEMNKKEFFIYLTGEALLPGGGGDNI